MRKNKIGDILFGLLLLGFILSNLTGCGQAEQSAPTITQQTKTATLQETEEQSASQETEEQSASQETEEQSASQETEEQSAPQETEEQSASQEQVAYFGPEDRDCTSYVIPDGVREIGDGAFKDCSSLTGIEIPDSVTVIGKSAFYGCSSLTGIEIPDSVTKIDNAAFLDCSSLSGIEIPGSVTEIGGNAFNGCSSLTSIEIPGSVTKIGGNAFNGCSSLTSIEISDSVTEIENGVFQNCSSLTSIEIPDSVTRIGESAFKGCSSLTSVEIPDGVRKIDEMAFGDCSSLTSVTLPKNLNISFNKVFGSRYSDIQFINAPGTITLDPYTMSSLESIKSVCGLVAPVEEKVSDCHWDSYSRHPYDVVYDFGDEYMAYVDACDWSLVFDADYYMSQFPMLALQYHYDEEELLFHFQTVGVHEGRQGSKDFNVCAYAMNGDRDIQDAFGSYYEGYYLYYMLNYDTEKDVDTVDCGNKGTIRTQYAFRPTALQMGEADAVNDDRCDVGTDRLKMVSETCAFANYRAYLNAHDGWKAHDWAIKNDGGLLQEYQHIMGGTKLAENTVELDYSGRHGEVTEHYYYNSKSHYDAMVSAKYNYIGVSNVCNGKDGSSQFDFFIDAVN